MLGAQVQELPLEDVPLLKSQDGPPIWCRVPGRPRLPGPSVPSKTADLREPTSLKNRLPERLPRTRAPRPRLRRTNRYGTAPAPQPPRRHIRERIVLAGRHKAERVHPLFRKRIRRVTKHGVVWRVRPGFYQKI